MAPAVQHRLVDAVRPDVAVRGHRLLGLHHHQPQVRRDEEKRLQRTPDQIFRFLSIFQ